MASMSSMRVKPAAYRRLGLGLGVTQDACLVGTGIVPFP
jgi:hypothetical protein